MCKFSTAIFEQGTQHIIIAIVASIVCIVFKVEDMGALETVLTCVFATMSAGGIADMKKVIEK